MSILGLSKQHMYSFYYDILKPTYGNDIRMLCTDTDSLVLHIKKEDVYDDSNDINYYMDFSGYAMIKQTRKF